MKIAYSERTLSVLESLQIQAENTNGAFQPKTTLNDEQLAENMRSNSSNRTNDEPGFDSSLNFFKSYKDKLPTKHEDPIDYPKLVLIFEKVVEIVEQLGYELPEKVSLGTICAGNLNAHIINIDDKNPEYVLLFNRQLFLFNDFFARFIAWSITKELRSFSGQQTLTPREPNEQELENLDNIIYYLINTIKFHREPTGGIELIQVWDKFNGENPLIETKDIATQFKEMMVVPMTAFIIAHEIMHVHVKHRKHIGKPLDDMDTKFQEEIFCDIEGLKITTQVAKYLYGKSYPQGWQKFATVSPILFLSCLDITHKASYVLHTGNEIPKIMEEIDTDNLENNQCDSYPTTLFRLQLVYSSLRRIAEDSSAPNPSDWLFENSDWIDSLFVDSWKVLESKYLNRYTAQKQMFERFQQMNQSDSKK